jgi:tetratricopeptide (TPR) repeat protein
MWKNDIFNKITEQLLAHRLGEAIALLENYLLSHPGRHDMEQFRTLTADYQLLTEYWRNGYEDPMREKVYNDLLHRMYVLSIKIAIRDRRDNSSFLTGIYGRARKSRNDWHVSLIRSELENYVSDVAMLSLEPAHQRKQKADELYGSHQKMMHDLFDYIWTSHLWSDSLADAFTQILLSPTIDSNDQQLIVSAVMLSAMNAFDFNKFQLLANVYMQSTDNQVRQRALVGWVFTMDADMAKLYPEMTSIILTICKNEECLREITELQMQLVYCIDAENDTRRIHNEIMPDLLNNSNFKITRQGIVEADEDMLEDILHPDADERRLEQLENSMQKMAEMQQQGSDIYFGGFSQMKRFPFFDDISNWFAPFYSQHPGISHIWNHVKGRRFLHSITRIGAFCDSDKYSFVLAFEKVLDRMPQSILSLIEQGEAVPMPVGGQVDENQQQQPAFIRRIYLQNLYRFFRLFPMRSDFRNPFTTDTISDYVFISNPLLSVTPLQKHFVQIAAFFRKRHMNEAAATVLMACEKKWHDYHYYMMMGTLLQHDTLICNDVRLASEYYSKALQLRPDSEQAMSGLARALFKEQNYQRSLEIYSQLVSMRHDNIGYELGLSICQINLNDYDAAMQRLFKLNYNHPENNQIKRSLAWTLTLCRKYDQAEKLYDQLLAVEQPLKSDILNYGYCLWFQRDITRAISMFRQFLDYQDSSVIDLQHDFCETEAQLISDHGINHTEVQLMLDQLITGFHLN